MTSELSCHSLALLRAGSERSKGFTRSCASLRITFVCGLGFLYGIPAAAQVGHAPGSSPYRDIPKGHSFTATGGYFAGDGGDFEIGPHKGALFGARYDIRTGSTIQLGLGVAHGTLERFIVNPFVRLANRRSGPVDQSVTFAEVDVQLNVTGGKTWNRIAPFVGLGGGLAVASSTPADTSQYEFGRKFYVVPYVGSRIFLSDRLHLRAEARAAFWNLDYPTTFQQEPVEEPGTEENPNAVIPGENLSEWTNSSWLQIGLGYSFSP
jgi:hypothetical protein